MNITYEEIKKRKSVRTFEDRLLLPEIKETFVSFIQSNQKGPFGNEIRFELIDLTGAGQEELKQLASYGNIRGPKYFMAGVVKKNTTAVLDYGYLMEKNILAAVTLGIGTVWVGGTFSRAGFMKKIEAKADEIIPAVVPLGYAAKIRDVSDTATRLFVAADTRKSWKDIFFNGNHETLLTEEESGNYKIPLAALRLAPSASNKQPWRIIKDGEVLHLFLERTPGYWQEPREDIQLMDMGIGMCNFDMAAQELGLNGKWEIKEGPKGKDGWIYIASRGKF
ncbi:MAG: nitroreductase family protein [bacterium]